MIQIIISGLTLPGVGGIVVDMRPTFSTERKNEVSKFLNKKSDRRLNQTERHALRFRNI